MIDFRDIEFVLSAHSPRDFPDDPRPQVCFAGRSNVGKSSLLNTLVGRSNMARTSKTPGRTREINFFRVADEFYFVDLPGYGFAKAPKKMRERWGKLIESYLVETGRLCLTVIILDVRHKPTGDDLDLISWFEHHSMPYLLVLTKSDKVSGNGYARQSKMIREALRSRAIEDGRGEKGDVPRMIRFSAKTGQGRRELIQAILDAVGQTAKRQGPSSKEATA